MNLTITLSQDEHDHMLGWVNKGIADPAFAANPYRIVLEERTQARFDQIKAQFYPPVPGPTPTPGDPLARVNAAPSQWAKWLGLSDAEATALIDGGFITREQKNQNNNWWALNGVKGRHEVSSGRYIFYTYSNGQERENIDRTVTVDPTKGAADAATEAASGKPIPGPALP